jgi:hypothetical protein
MSKRQIHLARRTEFAFGNGGRMLLTTGRDGACFIGDADKGEFLDAQEAAHMAELLQAWVRQQS